jgi:hypothetical protein
MELTNDFTPEEPKPEQLTDRQVFTNIWLEPKRVFRFIEESGYQKYFVTLLVFAGMARGLDRFAGRETLPEMGFWGSFIISIVVGGLLGWLGLLIWSQILSWTGKWIKGVADGHSIAKVVAYSSVPYFIYFYILLLQVLVLREELFFYNMGFESEGILLTAFLIISLILQFVSLIWSFVLLLVGLSVVQKFSIGKAILNLLIPALILLVPLMIIVALISGLRG